MTNIIYIKKNLALLDDFTKYMKTSDFGKNMPKNASIIFFVEGDDSLNKYNLGLLKLYRRDNRKVIEATKTTSKDIPWRVAASI